MPSKRDLLQQLRQSTFTGRQAELSLFRSLLPLDRPSPTCVLVIYGIGGIGKTALLDQYFSEAATVNVWTARLDPRVQASIFDFLLEIYQQLRSQVRFTQFKAALERHHEIENKLLRRGDIPRSALHMFAKGAHAALKAVPVAGEIVADIVSPEQIASSISMIYGAVGRGEGDFWMKPEDELTERLVSDLNAYVGQHRIVVMFDSYEWIGAFDDWVRERLFNSLDSHVLMVIGGRRKLSGKGWSEFNSFMQQVELKPLGDQEALAYLQKKGVSDAAVALTMVEYADGHPLVLAMLTDLAGQGHTALHDLAQVPERRQIVHELLDRIRLGMADSLNAALEACAILRLVNEDNLAWMLDEKNVGAIFDTVWRFDFVKTRIDGIALHESVWDALNEELRWRNPARYCELHAKAAEYYDRALAQPNPKDRERLELERLYHRIRADEVEGIKLFQEQAEELVRLRLTNRLRALLADVNGYLLEQENSRLWREYYEARLFHLEAHFTEAEGIYKKIAESESAEPMLTAYALCDLGGLLTRGDRIGQPGGVERAIGFLERSLKLGPRMDAKLLSVLSYPREVYVLKYMFSVQIGQGRDLRSLPQTW